MISEKVWYGDGILCKSGDFVTHRDRNFKVLGYEQIHKDAICAPIDKEGKVSANLVKIPAKKLKVNRRLYREGQQPKFGDTVVYWGSLMERQGERALVCDIGPFLYLADFVKLTFEDGTELITSGMDISLVKRLY